MNEDEFCPNCDCELKGDCCGGSQPYRLDEIDYCCEDCALDGECECGCVASLATQPTDGQAAPSGPPII
jgi:hypothetical protein